MKKKILFVFSLLVIIMICSCGSSSGVKGRDAEDGTKEDEYPLTEQQMIYNCDGYTLYASYIDFEEYEENGIGIAMYAINNSGVQRFIQTSYASINGYSVEMTGVNKGSSLLDGQKGWFYQIIYYDDLDVYGIDTRKDLKSLRFQLQIWNEEEIGISDKIDIELAINKDMTLSFVSDKNVCIENSEVQKTEDFLKDAQIIYDSEGYTLYISHVDFEEYGENGIGIAMYAINNSGEQRDVQTSYAAINGNSIEMNGVNQGGCLLDGQRGWFYQIIYYDDLNVYGIDVNKDLEFLSFQLQIWNKEEFEILDKKDVELIINQDMTFNFIDNVDDVYTVQRVYGIASNMKKSDLDGTIGNWSYQGLPLLSDDCAWIDNSLNKNGTVNQSAIYMKIANCLEGFAIGNDWKSYAEWVVGYVPESKEEFAEYVDNAKEFIVTDNQLIAIMKKLNTLNCVEGQFDFDSGKFGTYIVDIQDLTVCAQEIGVSEEMLGYIFAMVGSYGANISFNGNGCHIEF